MSEMRGRGCSLGGIDPSNLHLKKELTQIRKAARVLRDPGTSSSWRSPMSSTRSAAAIMAASSSYGHSYRQNKSVSVTAVSGIERDSKLAGSVGGREKKVFLHNWIMQRSSSEKSANTGKSEEKRPRKEHVDDSNEETSSCSAPAEESVDDSLSDARHEGDTKSDTCLADRYASMAFKCNDAKLISSAVKRANPKRKAKKNVHSSAFRQKMLHNRNSKQSLEGVRSIGADLGRDDSVSLIDQSDDTEGYGTYEEFGRAAASSSSPLLSMLKKSKILKNQSKKEDSSFSYSTPALSTSSYNRYFNRNPSTVGSWDATTVSFNDGDDEVDDTLDLPGQQGCGIPCYWSKKMTPKNKGGCGSCYSPSLSDTLRRKGNQIFCGSQTIHQRNRRGSSGSKKKRLASRSAQGVIPLLTNGDDGQGDSSMGTDDELSTNYGEIDLEALCRLDGRRWSTSCRSQEGLELVALNGDGEVEGMHENMNRSLSQKYRPMFFEEIVGQTIVVQSLVNAVSRGKISPVYLFQGPRGTGKTSMARVFAAALNCLATEETKPCGVCRECADFISGKSRNIKEVDITGKKGIESFKHLFKTVSSGSSSSSSSLSRWKVFVIDECHLLPSKMWLAFMKFLEDPSPGVVFLFSTTDLDNVPRTVLSRCQKYIFNKIKDGDIVTRLRKLSEDENLDIESDALDLIAVNADGSLRDAETMLDQLSLFGKRITTSLVNELIGVVSEEKLLELLELALSSDTAETVKKAREMMDSGVDPIVVMSQLATLIMDIIAGTYHIMDSRSEESTLGGENLTEGELERFKHALKLLSEAEKQLRASTERSTWFTATLLQLGSIPSSDPPTQSGSSRRQSSKTTEEDPSSTSREAIVQKHRSDPHYSLRRSSCSSPVSLHNTAFQYLNSREDHNSARLVDGAGDMIPRCTDSSMLGDVWLSCIEKCHSKTLKQLLLTHGKLISILQADGYVLVDVAFTDGDIKIRAERFLSSITNSLEIVLQCNVEVRMIVASGDETRAKEAKQAVNLQKQMDVTKSISRDRRPVSGNTEIQSRGGSFDGSSAGRNLQLFSSSSAMASPLGRKPEIQNQRIETIIREQRLENAWLQAMEKGATPGSINRLKPEKNQVLPQDGIFPPPPHPAKQLESVNSLDKSSQRWQDELNHEIRLLNIDNVKILEDQTGNNKRVDHHHHHHPISPSLLHGANLRGNFNKDNMGYESGTGAGGCGGLFCWNNRKHSRRGKVVKMIRPRKGGTFSLFGGCVKSRKAENGNRVRR